MPAGRPSKPIEQKRLLGNPGKRAMPQETIPLEKIDKVPEPPRPLLKYGRDFWDRTWEMGRTWISQDSDMELLLITCELIDERWNLRAKVMQEDDARGRRALAAVTAQLISNLSLLGFTPSDRSRLGVAEVKAQSKLEELMARRNAQD